MLSSQTTYAARGEALARRIETFLERRQIWVLAGWTVAILAIAISIAKARPFWFDEIFTLEVARPDASLGIFEQLRRGFDLQPPPFFLLTRLGFVFSDNEQIALRLPGILGFWLMTVCVYRFVQRRGGAIAGLLAIAFVLNTIAVRYMVEARPYGLVLGFSGLALVCWQAAAEEKRSAWAIAGMTIGIVGTLSCSYYGVLVLVPVACGELIRAIVRWKRGLPWLDLPIWLGIAIGGAAILPWLALVRTGMGQYAGRNWASPGTMSFLPVYRDMIPFSPLLLIAGTIVAAIYATNSATGSSKDGEDPRYARFSVPEMGVAVAFALVPIAGLVLAFLKTNAYTTRYVLDGSIGIGILLAVATWNGIRARALGGICILLATLGVGAVYQLHLFSYTKPDGAGMAAEIAKVVAGQPEDLPIAMDAPLPSLESMHYGKPAITNRLVFMVDTVDQPRYAGVPYAAGTWLELAKVWPGVHAESFEPFALQHRRFLLLSMPADEDFLLPLLEARHADLRIIGNGPGMTLYAVNMDGAGSETAR